MSRGESETMAAIGDELAIDDLRQLTLEAAQRFARGLVLGELAIVVVPPEARVHGLDARREVERVVERTVATAREPMASASHLTD